MRRNLPTRTARVATFASAALASLTTLAVAALTAALYPRRVPPLHNSYVIDAVFASQPVIWAARLLVLSAAFVLAVGGAFVVASTVVRTRNGDWLKRAGPFEVSEARVAKLEDEVHLWRSAAYDFHDAFERCVDPLGGAYGLNEEAIPDDDYDRI